MRNKSDIYHTWIEKKFTKKGFFRAQSNRPENSLQCDIKNKKIIGITSICSFTKKPCENDKRNPPYSSAQTLLLLLKVKVIKEFFLGQACKICIYPIIQT